VPYAQYYYLFYITTINLTNKLLYQSVWWFIKAAADLTFVAEAVVIVFAKTATTFNLSKLISWLQQNNKGQSNLAKGDITWLTITYAKEITQHALRSRPVEMQLGPHYGGGEIVGGQRLYHCTISNVSATICHRMSLMLKSTGEWSLWG